jgi:hypothetical protein
MAGDVASHFSEGRNLINIARDRGYVPASPTSERIPA